MSTLVAQTISNGTVSTSSANVIQGSAKAWANFNGVTGSIRASYNVSSITQIAGANWQVNFTNAMADADYSIISTCSWDSDGNQFPMINNVASSGGSNLPTASNFRVAQRVFNNSGVDGYKSNYVYVSVFR